MITIEIPDFGEIVLKHAVFDYNGTLAVDGLLSEEIRNKLSDLSGKIKVHILTADTFGMVATQIRGLPVELKILEKGNEAEQKLSYIEKLGAKNVICFGNGNNDRLMLKNAAIGVVVIGAEGCSKNALLNADIVLPNIFQGLDLLEHPLRIKATLRG